MKVQVGICGVDYLADLTKGLDISLPLAKGFDNVNCYFAPLAEFSPVRSENFVGSVVEGSPVNFFNVRFNPHGNGTHTECLGHISGNGPTIRECLSEYHFTAKLVTVYPFREDNGDLVIQDFQIDEGLDEVDALIVRTMPNDEYKKRRNYSGTNPPYFSEEAATAMAAAGIRHLLIDLPSVDPEKDEGKLLAHKAFWQFPGKPRVDCTITELIFVDNTIKDGLYLLNLQTASFELDVSPSKPVLYPLLSVV